MIRCLGAVFYLAQSLVDVGSGFTYGFCEQLRIHEMGAGAGGKVEMCIRDRAEDTGNAAGTGDTEHK